MMWQDLGPILGGATVLKNYDANKWARYSPGGLGLSLELPGGLELLEVPVPEEAKREYSDLKAYVYQLWTLTAFVYYMEYASPPDSGELKKASDEMISGIAHRAGHSNARFTTKSITKNKLLVSASYTKDGYDLNINGSVQSKGNKVWWVLTLYQQGDNATEAVTRRIKSSVTIN